MKRETDYKRMYQEMLFASEEAIDTLSNCLEQGEHEAIILALRTLIQAQRTSEEIYIETSEDNLVYLNPNDDFQHSVGGQ